MDYYGWLPKDELGVSGVVSNNMGVAKGYINQALANIQSLSTDWIFDDNIPELVMPTVNWNELDPGGIMSYFNSAYDKFMTPAINTDIVIEDVPELDAPDVDYTYDTEPMDVMKAKIKADIAGSLYGPEAADKTGLDTRAIERAGVLSGAFVRGDFTDFGMSFPATARSAMVAEYSRNANSAMAAASRDSLIAYNSSLIAGKSMTIATGLDVNRAIFQEFAIKLEALLDVFNAKIDGYLKRVEAKTLTVGYEYDHYTARVKAYSAMVGAMDGVIELASKNLDTTMSVYRRRIEVAVDAVKATIGKLVGIADIQVGAEKTLFDANRAVAVGALSIMNVQASVDSSVSGTNRNSSEASASETVRNDTNESKTEAHTYTAE